MKRLWSGLGLALILLVLATSTAVSARQRVPGTAPLGLREGETVGQTFVAYRDGLEAVELYLQPSASGNGEIYLSLHGDPSDSAQIAAAVLPLSMVVEPNFYRFTFPRQDRSRQQSYYIELELRGDGQLDVGSSPGEAYPDGAAYQNGEPVDAQLAFRPAYALPSMLLGFARQILAWLLIGLVGFLLFVLPGWGLLALAWRRPDPLPMWQQIGLAGGISLSIHPILVLATNTVGPRLGALYAWLPALAGLAALLWHYRRWRPRPGAWRGWLGSERAAPDLALAGVFGLVLAGRLLAVGSLQAPMWGDSYQHTMMAQLFLDHDGLYNSWQPYAPYSSLTVQFGFPFHVALFSWLTGMSSVEATILVGQLVNALAVLTLYPLAVWLAGGNRWAGVVAVLVAGLLSPMPAFYTNWGRYAQLDGQAILPVALFLLCSALERERVAWSLAALGGAVVAGMTLAYYRMPFYLAPFMLALLLAWGLPRWRLDLRRWLRAGGGLALAGGVALLLFLPWAIHVRESALAQQFGSGEVQGTPLQNVLADYGNWRSVTVYVPPALLALALAGLFWSLVRRRWVIASAGLWVALMSSIVAGRLFKLPGANLMQNFAIIIALYIPVALLVGWLASELIGALERRGRLLARVASGALLLVAGVWGAWGQQRIVEPFYMMVTRPDMEAMAWIRANTPTDARFLVEGFTIFGGTSAVGADAGWWIPLLAGRSNTMPPQYAMLNEAATPPDYTEQVVELVDRLEEAPLNAREGISLLCDWGITHVYIGQGQGRVGFGVTQLFAPDELVGNPAFEQVYRRDRVSIFALNQQACGA